MSAFLTPCRFEDRGGLPFILYEPLVYHSDLLGRDVTVPAGFDTDLASIPRGLWNIIPLIGKYDRAAVVHDYLYRANGVTRAEADAVLNEAMGVSDVGRWTRWLIYSAVRVGGGGIWDRHRTRDEKPGERAGV